MNPLRIAIPFLVLCLSNTIASAADFSDPTWPCLQRKVEDLSIGIMWPHPIAEDGPREEIAEEASDLAEVLTLRRVTIEEGRDYVSEFASKLPDLTTQDLGAVFSKVFNQIQRDRREIMQGIARYSTSQIALADSIDKTRAEISSLTKAENPDYDQIDLLEEKLDWDERIFRDRAQSLTYICETPVLLEKRAFAIAQLLLEFVPE